MRCPATPTSTHSSRAVQDAGVALVGLNFFAGDMPGGDRGLVSWPARSAEFRDNIPVVAAIGERLGCKAFNALYGNRVDGASAAEQDDLGAENLALAAQGVAGIGGTVLVEPVSGSPRYPLLTAADVAAVIGRVDPPTAVRPTSGCSRTCTTSPSTATTSTRPSPTTPARRAASRTYRSPTPPDAARPAPASFRSTGSSPICESAGYRGWVGLEYKAPPTTPTPQPVSSGCRAHAGLDQRRRRPLTARQPRIPTAFEPGAHA